MKGDFFARARRAQLSRLGSASIRSLLRPRPRGSVGVLSTEPRARVASRDSVGIAHATCTAWLSCRLMRTSLLFYKISTPTRSAKLRIGSLTCAPSCARPASFDGRGLARWSCTTTSTVLTLVASDRRRATLVFAVVVRDLLLLLRRRRWLRVARNRSLQILCEFLLADGERSAMRHEFGSEAEALRPGCKLWHGHFLR